MLKLLREYKRLKREHNILKKRVLNNQSINEYEQAKFHKDFLKKKNEFEKKYNNY